MPAPEAARGASDTTDIALEHERQHLSEARAALHRMRAHTAGLTALGADHVSTEHLKQVLYRRMKALEDDPTVPLFFGRLDYDTSLGGELDETLYIGRRHVTGEVGGEPLVIDWRAPDVAAVLPGPPAASRWASGRAAGSASRTGS